MEDRTFILRLRVRLRPREGGGKGVVISSPVKENLLHVGLQLAN